MSLPQKASLVSSATRTYSLAVQDVLTLKQQPTNEANLQSIRGRLPYLRRLITCCACGGILDDAMVSACDHHYCFECQFREPVLPIHCRQCRDRVGLVPALQLRTLTLCYHNLCHLLATFYASGVATGKLVIATGDVSPRPPDGCDPIAELLKEASSVVYKCPLSVFRVKVPKEPPFPTGLDHSSAASLPGSPCLGSKSQQPIVGSTLSDTPACDSPLMGLEVKQAHTCGSSPPPGVASTPDNPEGLGADGEARAKQGTDQDLQMDREARTKQRTDEDLRVDREARTKQRTDEDLGVDREARTKQRTDEDLGVDREARTKQRTDEGMTEHSDHKTDLPAVTSFTTSTGMNSINDTCIELPIPIVAKRRKVNRSWK